MTPDEKAAIIETAAMAKALSEIKDLAAIKGGIDPFDGQFAMQVLLPKASAAEVLHPQPVALSSIGAVAR